MAKLEFNETQKGLFRDSGINPDDANAVLSLMLAAPMGVANMIGAEDTIKMAIKLAASLPPGDLSMLVEHHENFDPKKLGFGVIITDGPNPEVPPLPKLAPIKKFKLPE